MSTPDVRQSSAAIPPAPPRAPVEYTQEWARQLNRWFENYTRLADFPAVLRGGRLYLPSLPASGYGLIVGEVYRDGDVLRIVLENGAYMQAVVASGSVGTLTVTV
jgi:hypothetical protein